MSAIVIAAILVAAIIAICLVLIRIHNKYNREAMNKLLHYFSKAGEENNLQFSSQEILKDSMIGLDGIHRKLLVVTAQGDGFDSFVIDLDKVKNCTVKKRYGSIQVGGLKTKKLDQYLEKIALHFEFKNDKAASEVLFYRHNDNHVHETPELEYKAKHWQAILSKMRMPLKNIA